jgi:cytochrome c-type biogenesis protein CcmE
MTGRNIIIISKRKYWIGGIILVIAIASLGFMAFRGAATYYYTVSEILNSQKTFSGRTIRVAGEVAPNSVQKLETTSNAVKFVLLDRTDTQSRLTISYKGAVPDAFKEGNEAVVEGKLGSGGIFEATRIIVKCPSKYEAKTQ